jgi:hypothetical protein
MHGLRNAAPAGLPAHIRRHPQLPARAWQTVNFGFEQQPGMPRRWMVALILVSWAVAGGLYLLLPPSPDQFNHAYLGWRMVEGERLYADVQDMNWPAIAGGHALAIWLFGTEIWSWHAFDLIATAACLADLLRLGYGRRAAGVLLVSAPWTYVAYGYWVAGQHDMSAAQFLAVALWCHVRGGFKPLSGWAVGSGVAIGLAVLSKPTMALMLVLLPLQGLWLRQEKQRVVGHMVVVAAAAVATVLAVFALLVFKGTPALNLIDAMWHYNAARRLDKVVDYPAMFSVTGWWPLGLAVICAPAIARLASPQGRNLAATSLLLMSVTGVVSYFVQATGNSYHLAPACLAGMAWAAVVVSMALERGRQPGPGWVPALLSVVFLLGIGSRLVFYFGDLPAAVAARDPTLYLAKFRENDGLTLADSWRLGHDIARRDDSGCLLVAGRTSSVNFFARLPQPTRFYFFNVIKAPPQPMAGRWAAQWETDLAHKTCRFALVTDAAWLPTMRPGPEADRVDAALRQLLGKYATQQRVGASQWTLYERTRTP